MHKNQWAVIVNPAAGAGSAQKKWPSIEAILEREGFDFNAFVTESSSHAITMVAKCVESGYRNFILVGGDGTINEGINGMMSQQAVPSSELTFGMIPVGSGNDWIRTWRIPREPEVAVRLIRDGVPFLHDAGKVSYTAVDGCQTRYFLNAAGTGLDSLVVKTANERDKHGSRAISYFICLLKELFRYRTVNTELRVDGQFITKEEMLDLAVGICRYIGGGMHFFPQANPADGLFEVTFIAKMNMLHILRSVPKLFNGKLNRISKVRAIRGEKIYIDADTPLLLEADGEVLGANPFSFEIIPNAIRVIAERFPSAEGPLAGEDKR